MSLLETKEYFDKICTAQALILPILSALLRKDSFGVYPSLSFLLIAMKFRKDVLLFLPVQVSNTLPAVRRPGSEEGLDVRII
ncbi:MAG TPA: hypothetical protein H9914_03880 [Candidatus Blautia avicola]|uniref:Uncharacterized protein n=1 Tax=Candidatus Blautia avicola TaxID=2838483 RepID=A0A9D2TXK3_9FIRM|nr:hypothetical protein [Candidatus Blautia avicola]